MGSELGSAEGTGEGDAVGKSVGAPLGRRVGANVTSCTPLPAMAALPKHSVAPMHPSRMT